MIYLSNIKKYICLIIFTIFILAANIIAQSDAESVYFMNNARHSTGELCEHLPPATSFTAYLNQDQSKILIENAPRWQEGTDPNINGNGGFGVELGNFIDPAVQAGDSVFVRFTCNTNGEQGTIADSVTSIPWHRFTKNLYLTPKVIPPAPQNLNIDFNSADSITISWDDQEGMTYSVYKRSISDTLPDGQTRNLYSRIAEGLTEAYYTDTNIIEGEIYAYIVYAVSGGSVFSSHSKDILNIEGIANLETQPQATTVFLRWNEYESSLGEIAGYNVYRRTETGNYGQPIAYTNVDTFYIDSRLTLAATYYYKVTARLADGSEAGESEDAQAVTLSSTNGFYTYANLKTAVVIYTNTNRGSISGNLIPEIKTMLNESKLFYWLNSGMKLNVQLFYHIIDDMKIFSAPDDAWGSMHQTAEDLRALGVMNTQYDIIFRINPAVNGYWSFGVQSLDLPGPVRQTGFSHSTWPAATSVKYPGDNLDIDYGITWIFVHEVQHAIDALYNVNEHPEMYHGDQPSEFPVACGEHFDFQAKMFRTFNDYEDLLSDWGNIYEAVDADNDGFPDNDPLTALDEMRFGGNPSLGDSDDDGYSDRQEALDGIYSGSNPLVQDTDADGIKDGDDEHPRYPVDTIVKYFTPLIDGVIESEWPLANNSVVYSQNNFSPQLYLSYDNNFLYLALRLEQYAVPELTFDFHSDGWWHSSGNTLMKINPDNGTFSVFHSWDASQEVRDYSGSGGMWDDEAAYQTHFNRRVVYPDSVNLKVNYNEPPIMQIEMSIPKRDFAGITLNPGDLFGLNIGYLNVSREGLWAATFDQYDFVYFTLKDYSAVDLDERQIVNHFELFQNYPNPFNPQTNIKYAVPNNGYLDLSIYNILGQKIRTLFSGYQKPGIYREIWEGKNDKGGNAPSGIYFYKLISSKSTSLTGKMVLLR
jgi:fibronectin type 3 domain-containing protein